MAAQKIMETFTVAMLLTRAGAAQAMRRAASDWARIGPRVIAPDFEGLLLPGSRVRTHAGERG